MLLMSILLLTNAFTQQDVNTDTLTGHTDDVNSVSFSPDGNILASGADDGTILLWALTPSATVNTR